MEDYRNKTKKVQIGNVCIGGGEVREEDEYL